MAFFRGAAEPLLGGISKQNPVQRLPDQVTQQMNMLSDPVTGLRRRGGFRYIRNLPNHPGAQAVHLFNNGEHAYAAVVALGTGTLHLYDMRDPELPSLGSWQHSYLQDGDLDFLQHHNELYILNRKVQITEEPVADTGPDPKKHGFYYIQQGAFDKKFTLEITVSGIKYTVDHTTPSSGAANAMPDKVAAELATKLGALSIPSTTLTLHKHGGFVFIAADQEFTISTPDSESYTRISGASTVPDNSMLPARLPVQADGYICQVGYNQAAKYYRWSYTSTAWIECAAYGASANVLGLPVVFNPADLTLRQLQGAPRTAGDTVNVPALQIIGKRLTGFGSFQGRLLLLQGEHLLFSKSNDPEIFYRDSMTDLRDDDPIEIAGTNTLGVEYRHSLTYNGDLLLISSTGQGVVPGRTVLTPKTAVVSTTSHYSVDVSVKPGVTGNSVLYAATAGNQSSVWEMFPSEYNNQGVQAADVTQHLPNFFHGGIREVTCSSVVGFALVRDSTSTLKVHQFVWEGFEKVLSCWHEWSAPGEVVSAQVLDQTLLLLLRNATNPNELTALVWDITAHYGGSLSDRLHWDFYGTWPVQVGTLRIPVGVYTLDQLRNQVQFGAFSQDGTPVTFHVPDWADRGTYYEGTADFLGDFTEVVTGLPYKSTLEPTPPLVRDRYGAPVLTERALLHSFTVSVNSSGAYSVVASDIGRRPETLEVAAQRLYNYPVEQGLYSTRTDSIPLRLDLGTARVRFEIDGPYDWNLVALEYAYKYNQRQRRAQGTAAGG